MQNLTTAQAADLLTAATLTDVLQGRGGVALTDHMRAQYEQQLKDARNNVPADAYREAMTAAANRAAETTLFKAVFAWVKKQNVTD